jgi:hypothetical protein
MTESHAGSGSRLKRAVMALGMIIVGVGIAAGATRALAPDVGIAYIKYNNAHSNGKIPESDRMFQGVFILSGFFSLLGIAGAIGLRKKPGPKNLAIGVAVFGTIIFLAILIFVKVLFNFSW